MTYPSLGISVGASEQLDTDRQIERASNGAVRARMFYTSPKRSFKFSHPALDATDLATFDAFYAANLATSFDFVWPVDNVTYSCVFGKDPSRKPIAPGYVEVDVELIEA